MDAYGGRRKRRLEEEESEEEKMEKFFALIRSTKEARDRLSKERENHKKLSEEDKFKNVWNPTFQPEDFIHDFQATHLHLPGPSSNGNNVNDVVVHIPNTDPSAEPIAEAAPPPPPPPHVHDDDDANGDDHRLDLNLSL